MAKKRGAEAHNEAVRTATNIMSGGMLAAGGASSSVQAAKRQKESTRFAADMRANAATGRKYANFYEGQARSSNRFEQTLLNKARQAAPEEKQGWHKLAAQAKGQAKEQTRESVRHLKTAHGYDDSTAHYMKAAKKARRAKIGSAAAAGVGGAIIGGTFYNRYRKNKLERVKKPTRSRNGR